MSEAHDLRLDQATDRLHAAYEAVTESTTAAFRAQQQIAGWRWMEPGVKRQCFDDDPIAEARFARLAVEQAQADRQTEIENTIFQRLAVCNPAANAAHAVFALIERDDWLPLCEHFNLPRAFTSIHVGAWTRSDVFRFLDHYLTLMRITADLLESRA